MAHFAKIENNVVTNVVVVDNEHELSGQEFLNSLGLSGTWIQTSYSAAFRKKFASIADVYNEDSDRFEPPRPFPSWVWNEGLYLYEAPVAYPELEADSNLRYAWDEDTLSWLPI